MTTDTTATQSNASTPTSTPATPASEVEPLAPEQKTILDQYFEAARVFTPEQVLFARVDPDIVANNVRIACASLSAPAAQARVAVELPRTDLAPILDMSRLARAFSYAARQVLPPPKPQQVRDALKRGTELRAILFPQVEVCMRCGVIAKEEWEKLVSGRGALDLGHDLLDTPELFARYGESLRGKLMVDQALLDESRKVGAFICENVVPKSGLRIAKASRRTEAVELRDRLWTLLSARYQEARRVALYLWLNDADAHVPPLLSRLYKPRNPDKTEENKAKEFTPATNAAAPLANAA